MYVIQFHWWCSAHFIGILVLEKFFILLLFRLFLLKKHTLLLWQVGELTLEKNGFPFHFSITFFFQFYNKTLGFSQNKQAQHNRHILW